MAVATSSPAQLALRIGQAMEEYSPGATPLPRALMRSAALASFLPFFLFFLGHYFSLSLVLVDYLDLKGGTYLRAGGRYLWAAGDKAADAFVTQVMAIAAVSFLLLWLSAVATVSASSAVKSGRRLPLLESLSKARALWREPSSAARLYFTILFQGHLLSLVAVVVVSLAAVGDSLGLGTWHLLVSLLVLFSFLFMGILRSVGRLQGSFVPAEEEGGCGMVVVEAPWSTALALMEERKFHGFFLFFLSLLIVHGVLLMGRGFWSAVIYEEYWLWSEGFYGDGVRGIPLSPLIPALMNMVWMLGSCGLFGYAGVLLQVC